MYRPHAWIACPNGAYCWKCGVTQSTWRKRIQYQPMIGNGCGDRKEK